MTKTITGDNIILIGMPAVGKSTVGVLLAKCMGYQFIDTDLVIQSGEQRRLHQIIADIGMNAFCDLEASYIQALDSRQSVIATGGSVVYRSQAMAHLNAMGLTIFLDIDLAELKYRLVDLGKRGVVCTPGQTIEALYAERQPLYAQYAHTTVNCTALRPDAVVTALQSTIATADSFPGSI